MTQEWFFELVHQESLKLYVTFLYGEETQGDIHHLEQFYRPNMSIYAVLFSVAEIARIKHC